MSLLRTFLLWALMLAVPFQGYAAASMLGCAPSPPPVVAAMGAAPDHAAHDHHAANAPADTAAADHGAAHGDTAHKCGTCGACHAVALVGVPAALAPGALPPADLAEPSRRISTHTPRVLDKPPRA